MATDELRNKVITLTSDFGTRDWFVGVMKGVIASHAPEAKVIDISHDVESFDILAGAYVINSAYAFFPAGSIHVAVIDPTVGTNRQPVLIRAGKHFFIGPNNGLLGLVIENYPNSDIEVWILNRPGFRLENRHGGTFDGRDVFSAAAAALAAGKTPDDIGTKVSPNDLVMLENARAVKTADTICGAIIYKDKFGNLISNITKNDLNELGAANKLKISAGNIENLPLVSTYADIQEGQSAAIINSSGHLEICSYKHPAQLSQDSAVTVKTS